MVDRDVRVADGVVSFVDRSAPDGTVILDVSGCVITPGLFDAEHPRDLDHLAPLRPGPFIDRHRRASELEVDPDALLPAAATNTPASVVALHSSGATKVAGFGWRPESVDCLRVADSVWIPSLSLAKDPGREFASADGKPVFISVADGDSKAMWREVGLLRELGIEGPTLYLVGGVGLRPEDARAIAATGAALVWRPVTDEFVLGRTVSTDVLEAFGSRVWLGAGARRDGAEGILAAFRRAITLWPAGRERMLPNVFGFIQTPKGRSTNAITEQLASDLVIWPVPEFDELLTHGAPILPLAVFVGGRVVFAEQRVIDALGGPGPLRPNSKNQRYYGMF